MGLPTSVGTGVTDLEWDIGTDPKSGAVWGPAAGSSLQGQLGIAVPGSRTTIPRGSCFPLYFEAEGLGGGWAEMPRRGAEHPNNHPVSAPTEVPSPLRLHKGFVVRSGGDRGDLMAPIGGAGRGVPSFGKTWPRTT